MRVHIWNANSRIAEGLMLFCLQLTVEGPRDARCDGEVGAAALSEDRDSEQTDVHPNQPATVVVTTSASNSTEVHKPSLNDLD